MEPLILICAGLIAGAMNAVAGGGTFVSFPALVWAGIPPVSANATATFAALPGYLASAWAYRANLNGAARLKIRIGLAALGGVLGAGLLMVTPSQLFDAIVPWLLIVATAVFLWGPQILKRTGPLSAMVGLGVLFSICVYGGYFNGGLGIMLLAGLALSGFRDIHQMNGIKNLMSAVISMTSVAAYFAAGLIDVKGAVLVGVAGMVGGILGARFAQSIQRPAILRGGIAAIGAIMSVLFFLR